MAQPHRGVRLYRAALRVGRPGHRRVSGPLAPVVLVALLAIACGVVAAVAQPRDRAEGVDRAPLERAEQVDRFVWAAIDAVQGKTIAEIKRRLAPRAHVVVPWENPNAPGERWHRHRLEAAGISLEGVAGPSGEFFVERMLASTPATRLPQGFRIGMHRREVERVLGPPTTTGFATMSYRGSTETVVFHLKRDHVARVDFLVYLD